MDTTSTMIGIGLLLLFFIPIFLLNRKNKKSETRFKQKLFDFALNEKNTINDFEIWNNTAIGIDENSAKLFFIKKITYQEVKVEIDLHEVKECKLVNTNHSLYSKDGEKTIIDKLELVFTFLNKNENNNSLLIYDNDFDNLNMSGELQIAKKWEDIFSKRIISLQ